MNRIVNADDIALQPALAQDYLIELRYIAVITADGGWVYRGSGRLLGAMCKAGHVVFKDATDLQGIVYRVYQITRSGLDALDRQPQGGEEADE